VTPNSLYRPLTRTLNQDQIIMGRNTIVTGDIEVAYGYDNGLQGYFLSVIDRRLKWHKNASADANAVTESFGLGDGGGGYFDINTTTGFGKTVSKDVYVEFLKRYGVPEAHLAAVRAGQSI